MGNAQLSNSHKRTELPLNSKYEDVWEDQAMRN